MSQEPPMKLDGRGPSAAASEPNAADEALTRQVVELRRRLEEAEETIRAIREDEVDAFVISHGAAERVLTLESADRPYRRYVEAMRQAAVTLSREGTILYANTAFARLVMRPLESIVGGPIGPSLPSSCRPVLNEVIARRPDGRGEALLERGDGVVVPVHLTASGSAEEPDIVCLVITDLTDQRRLAEVTAAERLSRSILEQTVDAIVVGDRSGTLIRAGAAARRLCGRDPIGLAFDAAFPLRPCPSPEGPDDETPTSSWIVRGLSGETIRGAEVRLERGDGPSFHLLLGSGPIMDAGGAVIGFVATLTNITELRRVEDELREADRRKDEFLAVLAHELRNPLAAIGHAVQVARQSPDDEEARSWSAEGIERQARQLGHLVDDLLDVSRISRGKFQLRKELIDARTVIERAVQVVRPQAAEKGLELRLCIHEGPMAVEVDPTRLEQILINLLGNAAKYTDAPGRILLSALPGPGELVVRVEDTGIGIAPEKLPQVFELFEQVEDSIGRSRGGLGIGLTLVRRLTEMHGGAVSAESEGLGRGSTFSVRLPLAVQDFQVPT